MANYDSGQASEVKSAIDNLKEPLEEFITMYNDAYAALPNLHPETQKQPMPDDLIKLDVGLMTDDYGLLAAHFASSMEDMTEEDIIKSRDPESGFKPVEGTAEGENQEEESATADDVVEDEEGAAEGTEQEEQSAEADDIVEDIEGEAEGIAQAEQSANEETEPVETIEDTSDEESQVTPPESELPEEDQNEYIEVNTKKDGLRMRADAGTNSKVVGVAPKGSKLRVLDRDKKGWVHVEDENGNTSYVYEGYTKKVETPAPTAKASNGATPQKGNLPETQGTATVKTNGSNLNFREDTQGKGAVKGTIANGTELTVLEDDGKSRFVRVQTPDGQVGKVARKYLDMSKAAEKDPKTSGWNGEGDPTSGKTPASDGTTSPKSSSTPDSIGTNGANITPGENVEVADDAGAFIMRGNSNSAPNTTIQPGTNDSFEVVSVDENNNYRIRYHQGDNVYDGVISGETYNDLITGGVEFQFDKF